MTINEIHREELRVNKEILSALTTCSDEEADEYICGNHTREMEMDICRHEIAWLTDIIEQEENERHDDDCIGRYVDPAFDDYNDFYNL